MISIIICSQKPALPEPLEQNIASTIGCEYEVVFIYNEDNKYSIFEAYNIGIQKSRFDILCFMHDDILYHTNNWGKNVITHFNEENVGAIAVAGSKYLPPVPATWFSLEEEYMDIIQHYTPHDEGTRVTKNQTKELRTEIVAFDGVWFCIHKNVFNEIAFDTNTFKGFHAYDIDIAMQIVSKGYKIYAVFDVLIEHFSCGSLSKQWVESVTRFYLKWHRSLPIESPDYPKATKQKKRRDLWYLHSFLLLMKKFNIKPSTQKQISKLALKKSPFVLSKSLLYIFKDICSLPKQKAVSKQ